MLRSVLERGVDFTTAHTRITLLAMLLLSALVLAGIPQLDTESQAGASEDAFDDIDRVQKLQYVQANYLNDTREETNRTLAVVYARESGGNVLDKTSLLAELRYQQAVLEDERLQNVLHEDGILGLSNLVATRAVDTSDPDLETQIEALESRSEAEVQTLLEETLAEQPIALRFLPAGHDRSETTSEDRRLLVSLDTSVPPEDRQSATRVLYEEAESKHGLFTLGEHAQADFQSHSIQNLIELVLPLALAFILFVLAFAYRDLVDVVVGMLGVVLSVLWMVGLLGWLGVAAGTIVVVPIVLITGLSIDFGFHVFNRYREQRGPDDPIRASMSRGVQLVATALLLVTATAAIGFLSNLSNPLPVIRNLGVTITLGVVSSLIIFTTFVPALKIGIDGLLERVGLDRHKAPLGHGRYLGATLSRSVWLARRAAPAVVLLAVVVGGAGGLAWTALDQETYQTSDGDVAQWKQDLPDPIGWDVHEYRGNNAHVQEVYQPATEDDAMQSHVLIEGTVTGDESLERLADGTQQISESGVLLEQPETQAIQSPITAMAALAERNDSFAAAFDRADTDGNGVPDADLQSLYDQFYATDPETARRVIERTDGEYRSMLVTLSLDADLAEIEHLVSTLEDGADVMEEGSGDREATVAGLIATNVVVLDHLTDGILRTMVIALVAIFVTMIAVFRLTHGSGSLGAVVAIPIALVIGLVIGGMYLLEIPLTLLTALLMSLVIGLGIDYNIHLGDRFADEVRAGKSTGDALEASVRGTGGALLGSTLTSAGAFATITLVPNAQLQSFGVIVVLALGTAFLASVLVLPSMLWLWSRHVDKSAPASTAAGTD